MTYYLFLGLALATAGVGFSLRRKFPALAYACIVAGCIGCCAGIGWQLRENVFTPSPSAPDRGQAVVGYFLANQLLREVTAQQGTVLLFFPPESVIDSDAVGVYAGRFGRVLRGVSSLKVETVTLSAAKKAVKSGTIPLESFQRAASNAPPAVAYVSFAGVPADIEQFQRHDVPPNPPFLVYDPWGTTNWSASLKKGSLRCVIVPRPGIKHTAGAEISGEPNEVFRQLYLMATPQTVDQIAAELNAK